MQEAQEIAQQIIDDSNDACNVLCLQRCGTWIPCTQSEKYVGQGNVVSSQSNNAPELGRHGNVTELQRKKAEIKKETSVVEAPPCPPDQRERLLQLVEQSTQTMARISEKIHEMEVANPQFQDEYLELYKQTLAESGLLRHVDPLNPGTIMYHLLRHHCVKMPFTAEDAAVAVSAEGSNSAASGATEGL
jgi:hypothetical protein